MKIGDEVYIHGYVDEIRQNVVIIRNDGGYFGTVAEEIMSSSEIPNTCGDAISRDELLKAMDTWDKFGYTETGCFVREPKNDCVKYIHYDDVIKCIKGMPSVTPQQRTGRWIEVIDEIDSLGNKTWHYECSICGNGNSGWGTYKHCPDCGAKMEVEDAD